MNTLLVAFLISVSGDMPPDLKAPAAPAAPAQVEEPVPAEHMMTVERCSAEHQACIVKIEELAGYIRKRVEIAKELEALKAGRGCKPELKLKRQRDA